MLLPHSIDETPKGKLVPPAKLGTKGYLENTNYQLTIIVTGDAVEISYHSENGLWLDEEEMMDYIEKFNK